MATLPESVSDADPEAAEEEEEEDGAGGDWARMTCASPRARSLSWSLRDLDVKTCSFRGGRCMPAVELGSLVAGGGRREYEGSSSPSPLRAER